MKKMLILMVAVLIVFSVFTVSVFADNHDQEWRQHHGQVWKAHEREWRDHDRQWLAHSGDQRWREDHIRMWHDWYQWHRDNESSLNIRISSGSHDGPRLDIDFRN